MCILVMSPQANAKGKSLMFEVTITNITQNQIFSPAVVVSHRQGLDPLFQLGEMASGELAKVAEDADTGDVDLTDLATLLAAYGTCTGDPDYNPDADLDESGCVNLTDLAMLLANYGAGVP